MNINDLGKLMTSLVSRMGYTIIKITTLDSGFDIFANIKSPFGELKTLIRVKQYKNTIDDSLIREFSDMLKGMAIKDGILIITSDFTKGALDFAAEKSIRLIDGNTLFKLLEEHKIIDKERKIDHVFVSIKTDEEAQKYFDAKRKKKLLGRIGSEELITQIEKRYLPLGKFKVINVKDTEVGLIFKKKIHTESANFIYVDLTYQKIFWVNRTGIMGKTKILESIDVLERIRDIPPEVRKLLYDVMTSKNMRYEQLTNDLDRNNAMRLLQEGLIETHTRSSKEAVGLIGSQTGDGGYVEIHYVRSTFNLPSFENKGYDISVFMELSDKPDQSYVPDPLNFLPEKTAVALGELFRGTAELEEIIYLPYYICWYKLEDKKNDPEQVKSDRYEVLYPVSFVK